MNRTSIDYLTHSWNPIAMRCTRESPGCANCWHLAMAKRLAANPALPEAERAAYAGGHPVLRVHELEAPLHLRQPAVIGVQFMGDLFHESVSNEAIQEVFSIMGDEAAWQHKFLLLTKRPERIQAWDDWMDATRSIAEPGTWWPRNVWLGVSCENQATADERIPHLLRTPAALRWVSLEPLLGEVRLTAIQTAPGRPLKDHPNTIFAPLGNALRKPPPPKPGYTIFSAGWPGLDWVVVGCESGPKRRPCKIEWVRSVVEQCRDANVPCFVKQIPDADGDVLHPQHMPDGSVVYSDAWPVDLRVRQMPEVKP